MKKPVPLAAIWLSLLFLISVSASMSAQRILVTELPTQHLLPTSPVHRVLQDREGYMWYATEGGGLCRDDGYELSVFRSPFGYSYSRFNIIGSDSILSNHIYCIAEGKEHPHIWFGTKTGLYYIDKHDYSIHAVDDQRLRHSEVWIVFAASDGTIWTSTPQGLFHLDCSGKVIGDYSLNIYGTSVSGSYFHEDSRHNLRVLCTGRMILKYDPVSDSFIKEKWDFPSNPTCMYEDIHSGKFFVGTWGGGVLSCTAPDSLSSDSWHIKKLPEFLPDNSGAGIVLNLIYDSLYGMLWVAAIDNLYLYHMTDGQLQPVSTASFLPEGKKVIDLLFRDRDNNIWVPAYTPHTFIISFDEDKIERYPVDATKRLTGYPVMADAVVKEDDYYWIWQGRDNLTLYHPATDRISYASRNVENYPYTEKWIEKCSTGSGIWAVNANRLLRFTHKDMDIHIEYCLSVTGAEHITALHESRNRLWIGTEDAIYEMSVSGNYINKVCGGTGSIRQLAATTGGEIYAVAGKDGFIHVSTDGEITVIDKGDEYCSIAVAPNGTIWAATSQGSIYSYQPRHNVLTRENDHCLWGGESIKSLQADKSGHIWILTDQYLKEYNPTNNAFRIFHSSDSRIKMDYMHCVRLIDGNKVCVGGMGAFCIITSSADLDDTTASSVRPVVTSITAGDRHIFIGTEQNEVDLLPHQGDCKVAFSTLDHLHAGQVSYAYRLKGWQTSWTYLPAGSNTAYFNRLPKGIYQLELKATDRYGCWGEPYISLTLRRLPAWYETWWAYLIYGLIAISLVLGVLWLSRRISQLLELHRRRKEVALNTLDIRADATSLPKFDKEFLNKAVALVEAHLSDPHYNVGQFSSDLCMSRMNLYRKLRVQTGQSPVEFIRSIRLKKAAALLAATELPVKEVAQRCGFSTATYFSKLFKEMFGVLPGQYKIAKTYDSTSKKGQ